MRGTLRKSYHQLAEDYISKKRSPWYDFREFVESLSVGTNQVVLDLGGGNGRNLKVVNSTLPVVLDLSIDLLRGYVGPAHGQRVAGALPDIPFRERSADGVWCIAVLHHFREEEEVIRSMERMRKLLFEDTGHILISVWRKWRKGVKEKLFEAIRQGEETEGIYNVNRPWHKDGDILGTRFYHFYTYKELHNQLVEADLKIKKWSYSGGRRGDANIFVEVVSNSQSARE